MNHVDTLLQDVEPKSFRHVGKENFSEIVAYTVQGRPLTQEQYVQEIRFGLLQIEQEKTITDEDLQKEMETW